MPVLTPHATPVRSDASALLHVLEAYIETLKAENEILNRRLAAAEARAEGAIVELSALTERLTPAGDRPSQALVATDANAQPPRGALAGGHCLSRGRGVSRGNPSTGH